MKTSHIFAVTLLFITLVFVFASANINPPQASAHSLGAASLPRQISTPTPEGGDLSEVGSTDGIVIMGFVLAGIVILPVILHRKRRGPRANKTS